MDSDSSKPTPTIRRLRRFAGINTSLSEALPKAIKVATGYGPRGIDTSIAEARQEMAPKLVGVVSLKAKFQDRPWIFVTAPGPMMLGFRGQELLAVCHKVNALGRPVLLLRPDDVLRLTLHYDPKLNRPIYSELSELLRTELRPLYEDSAEKALSRPVRALDSY